MRRLVPSDEMDSTASSPSYGAVIGDGVTACELRLIVRKPGSVLAIT